jgi:hypothetical protein
VDSKGSLSAEHPAEEAALLWRGLGGCRSWRRRGCWRWFAWHFNRITHLLDWFCLDMTSFRRSARCIKEL